MVRQTRSVDSIEIIRSVVIGALFITSISSCTSGKKSGLQVVSKQPIPNSEQSEGSNSVRFVSEGLREFSAITGLGNDGEIDLRWQLPTSLEGVEKIVILRNIGISASPTHCNDGEEVLRMLPPFTQTQFTDKTGSRYGEVFSYRACIFNSIDHTARVSNFVNGIPSKDTNGPASLTSFEVYAATNVGKVNLHLMVPAGAFDEFESIEIRRVLGSIAPRSQCDDGVVLTVPSPRNWGGGSMTLVDDTVANIGLVVSYRVCIRDRVQKLNSFAVAEGILVPKEIATDCSIGLSSPVVMKGETLTAALFPGGAYSNLLLNGIFVVGVGVPVSQNTSAAGFYTVQGMVVSPSGTAISTCTKSFQVVESPVPPACTSILVPGGVYSHFHQHVNDGAWGAFYGRLRIESVYNCIGNNFNFTGKWSHSGGGEENMLGNIANNRFEMTRSDFQQWSGAIQPRTTNGLLQITGLWQNFRNNSQHGDFYITLP